MFVFLDGDGRHELKSQYKQSLTIASDSHIRRLGRGHPDQQSSDRVSTIERTKESLHFIPIPGIAALVFRNRNVTNVEVIEHDGDLH